MITEPAALIDLPTSFVLGQSGDAGGASAPPPISDEGVPRESADGSMPDGTGAGGAPADGFLFMLLPLVLLMILFSVFGQRKEKKKREALLGSIKKHDRVRTIGGVIGSVVEIKPDTIVLKVDESSNTRMTFTRDAVQQVLESSDDKS